MKLTKRTVENLTLPQKSKPYSKIFHDDILRGFALRVTSNGAKTFIINKKQNGKVVRVNIGRFGEYTPEEARRRATTFLGQLAEGVDLSKKPIVSAGQAITLKKAYEDYVATRKSLQPKSRQDYDSIMRIFFTDWQAIPLSAITREMVSTRHARIGEKHPDRANNAFKVLNAIFNFAIYQYADREPAQKIENNPVHVLSQTRAWFKKKRRTGKINHDQLPAWFAVVQALRGKGYRSIEVATKYYLILLLFTGLRKEEAAPLIWVEAATPEEIREKEVSYISLKDKILFIDKSKNGLEHTLPLSDYIHGIFTEYRKINSSRFVFPGAEGVSYINDIRKTKKQIVTISKVPFTLHDIRRTFATMANEVGIPAYTIKRLLNHKTPTFDVTAGYIVNDVNYLREPVNRIANYMLSIIQKKG